MKKTYFQNSHAIGYIQYVVYCADESSPMPRIAVRGVIYRNDEILLSHHRNEEREWYLIPGGGINHGESVEQAFHREMLEETGYRCAFGRVVMIREVMNTDNKLAILPDQFHQIEIYVAGNIISKQSDPVAMDLQQISYCWMPTVKLNEVTFFPGELSACFIHQDWSVIYRGVCL
jgi:8-oxo-dGTP diphosphatase